MEEVNFARASSVGLLVVEWPTSGLAGGPAATASIADSVDADQRLQLDSRDFNDGLAQPPGNVALLDQGVLRVLAHCARQRAVIREAPPPTGAAGLADALATSWRFVNGGICGWA